MGLSPFGPPIPGTSPCFSQNRRSQLLTETEMSGKKVIYVRNAGRHAGRGLSPLAPHGPREKHKSKRRDR